MITYPLNNIDYTAEDAELFHCTRTSGIWAEDSFSISVTGADNNVTIGTGIAWINNEEFSGKVAALKSAEILDLGIADGVYSRIDVIAIQFNANNNATDIIIKKGTPATNPVRPAIVRSSAVYELYLASVYRPAGAIAITASNITDLRMDETVCGLMADSVTSIDTSAINAQVEALIANLEAEIEGVRDTSGLMFESEWVEDGVIPISKGGTGAGNATDAKDNLGLGKSLWSGSWANGTINVLNTAGYTLFQIALQGQGTTVLAMKYSDYIRGIGGYTSADGVVTTYHFAATISGNAWTLVAANGFNHKPNDNHTTNTSRAVTEIYGLL